MKKLATFILAVFLFTSPVWAQSPQQEFKFDSQEIQKGLEEMFKDLDFAFDSSMILIDTLYFNGTDPFQLLPKMMDSFDMESLMDMMSRSMEQMQQLDMSEFEELFRDFDQAPLIPAPKNLEEEKKSEQGKSKKKKKTYKI